MVLPALVASVAAIYGTVKGIDTYRYWNDYHKNTGYRPRYPFARAGGYGGSDFVNSFKNLKRL